MKHIAAIAMLTAFTPGCIDDLDDLDDDGDEISTESAELSLDDLADTFVDCPIACQTADCTGGFSPAGFRQVIPFLATRPLADRNTCITRVIVVVHGNARNAEGAFTTVVDAARKEGALANTLIVAPHFQTLSDAALTSNFFWDDGWKEGGTSGGIASVTEPQLSSFEAVDKLLRQVQNTHIFPNLATVVIAGHSAGGQFVQRYAAGTVETDRFPESVFVRYVAANPGSYMFLNNKRKVASGWGTPGGCGDYNDYKYGTAKRNAYLKRRTIPQLRTQFMAQSVVLLLGELDVDRDDDLDTGCEADAQGSNRFLRGLNFFESMNAFYPGHGTFVFTVPGVGHSSRAMFSHDHGRYVLFH